MRTERTDGGEARLAVGVVALVFLSVAAGVFLVGGGPTGDGATEGADGADEDRTREVAVASESPAQQPYEYALNGSKQPDVSDLNTSRVESLVAEETNEVRANRSLGEVGYSSGLSDAARRHSENMSESFYLGHIEPDGTGVEERYLEECAALRDGREEFRYSENVANVWYKTVYRSPANRSVLLVTEEDVAEYLVNEWVNSTTHRRNLLGEDWRSVGVGVVVDENGTVFGTQAFCTAG
jgi:uncharacterized protein YkwD